MKITHFVTKSLLLNMILKKSDHGNKYSKNRDIIFVESTSIIIQHTKDIDTVNTSVLYRPAVFKPGDAHLSPMNTTFLNRKAGNGWSKIEFLNQI